jgi:hypothetical protein
MATAKKTAPKATKTLVKASVPAKKTPAKAVKAASKFAVKPVAKPVVAKKVPVSKAAAAIARINANLVKLNERKTKIVADINALKDQRAALKAAPVAVPAKAAKKTSKSK